MGSRLFIISDPMQSLALGMAIKKQRLVYKKLLQNHTQSTESVIPFFKESPIDDCDCKAYTDDLFKPVRMPRSVYDKMKEFPMVMPIPKPTGLGEEFVNMVYMSFAEAHLLLFTGEQQPSFASALLRKDVDAKKK
jgi:hypothetical protein